MAAAVVLAIAVVAALVTWGYVRNQTPAGSPLAVAVVFAAVLTAGAVGLVILAGRPELDAAGRGDRARVGGSGGGTVPEAGDRADGSPAPASATAAADSAATGSGATDSGAIGSGAIGSGAIDPADADPPTAEQPRTRTGFPDRQLTRRTALDPLGRRYGRHARAEPGPDTDEPPVPSELYHPLPSDLASTLHDQLFTHRSSGRE